MLHLYLYLFIYSCKKVLLSLKSDAHIIDVEKFVSARKDGNIYIIFLLQLLRDIKNEISIT